MRCYSSYRFAAPSDLLQTVFDVELMPAVLERLLTAQKAAKRPEAYPAPQCSKLANCS